MSALSAALASAWFWLPLAGAALALFCVAAAESDGRIKIVDVHHEYLGLAVLLIALALHWPLWVCAIALAVMCEDTYQHSRQVDEPAYLSPLHRLYVAAAVWLIHRPWCPPFLARLLAH